MDIKKLVEWVAQQCYESLFEKGEIGRAWEYVRTLNPDVADIHYKKAKQILSHPDLALIDRGREYPSTTDEEFDHWCRMDTADKINWKAEKMLKSGYLPVSPLAEELKQEER